MSEDVVTRPPGNLITGVVKAIRPRQWVKNVLVLAAPLAALGGPVRYDYGEVHFARDAASGLRGIVAVHDTRLGPALGGCRFLAYASERDALVDALGSALPEASISGIAAGLHVTVQLPEGDDEDAIRAEAERKHRTRKTHRPDAEDAETDQEFGQLAISVRKPEKAQSDRQAREEETAEPDFNNGLHRVPPESLFGLSGLGI